MSNGFTRFLPGLRSQSYSIRSRSARALCLFVESEARDLSSEGYTRVLNELSSRILDMLHGNDHADKLGGIVAMDELVDLFNAESNDQKIIQFAHSLVKILEKSSNADGVILRAATKALGHLVSTGGTTLIEFVEEYHLRPAMTWLEKESYHVRRHAAVLILKELAMNAPSIFYRYVDMFFNVIWTAMNDAKQQIRESAAEALQACLTLVQQRETNRRGTWYNRTLDEVEKGLIKGTPESMHGSLMSMNELLRNTGDFMYPHYEKVCKQVLHYKDHKSSIVRRAVINLYPRLAKFNTVVFIESYLDLCLKNLLEILKSQSSTKGDAFLSLGKLTLAVGSSISKPITNLALIMAAIRDGLEKPKKKEQDNQREALACLRMLADAVGPMLARVNIEDAIQIMFQAELNRTMIDTLTTLAKRVPNQRSIIQIKLYARLSAILTGNPTEDYELTTPGSPTNTGRLKTPNNNSNYKSTTSFLSLLSAAAAELVRDKPEGVGGEVVASTSMIILALDTLGSFDLQGNRHIPLMQFVHVVVVRFLDDDVAGIRKAAATTCCKLVLPPGEEAPTRGEIALPISAVLERLITVGIADTEADIRSKVLASLDSRFDPLLGQMDNLRCLFIALNDEVFEIRETAMTMLGRLTRRNPSYVMPALRQTLVQLLAELEYSSDSRGKEESAKLLGHLIRSSSHLVRPYVVPILKSLVMKVRDPCTAVGTAVLSTLGELSLVGRKDLSPYLKQLLPEIVNALKEQSSPQKLLAGLQTLGQLVGSTGYVIEPYFQFPDLLDILCSILHKYGDINGDLRLEAARTLGILGALDPYSLKLFHQAKQVVSEEEKAISLNQLNLSRINGVEATGVNAADVKLLPPEDMIPSLVGDPQQYFPTVVINALVRIFNDPRNSTHYQATVLAIMYICKSLGKKIVPQLHRIVPSFISALSRISHDLQRFLFQQLTTLVKIVRKDIQPYLDHIVVAQVVYQYWDSHLNATLTLIEEIASSLGDDFKVYLPDLIPELLKVIRRERERPTRSDTQLVLRAIVSLGKLLDGYLHLVIPVLVKLIQGCSELQSRKQALMTLRTLIQKLNVSEFASRIIHVLARIVGMNHTELINLAMDTLCCMVYTLGEDYAIFVPVLNQVLHRHQHHGDVFDKYEFLVSKILKYQPLPIESWAQQRGGDLDCHEEDPSEDEVKSLPINQAGLMKAWETSQRSTQDDWLEWMRAFSVELLRESPSPALRACKELASVYQPLARELFNPSFVSVWPHLSAPAQDNLVRCLEAAFQSPHLPSEILQALLNLAEFMEHDDQPLPIDIRLLGALAEKCHSFAKALHYKELEFNTSPSSSGIEALISINNKLNQFEAAVGILKYAQEHLADVEVKAPWHEKLNRWDDALRAHEKVLLEHPNAMDAMFGKMRCLYAVGRWQELSSETQIMWSRIYGNNQGKNIMDLPPAFKKELCSHAARVMLILQSWDNIAKFINSDMDPIEAELLRAIVAIRNDELEEARVHIVQCRKSLDPSLRSLVSESYSRAYMPDIIYLQNLVELEEIIEYKTNQRNSRSSSSLLVHLEEQEPLHRLQEIWTRRMLGVERNIEVWQRLLVVRSLVLDPKDDIDVWLKYSRLCRKSGQLKLAHMALRKLGAEPFMRSIEKNPLTPIPVNLQGPDSIMKPHPRVAFTYLKHLWAEGREEVAVQQLSSLIEALEIRAEHQDPLEEEQPIMVKLRVRAYLTLAEWEISLNESLNHNASLYEQVLSFLKTATRLDVNSYKAWHAWALMNFRASESCEDQTQVAQQYVAPAVKGFFRSIVLGHTTYNITKDVLRLLTLWFTYGTSLEVHEALSIGFQEVSIDTWLEVIPQLIARIHTANPKMNTLLHELLSRIGQSHPQALIYPITVASKSLGAKRKLAAAGILAEMRRHSQQLVNEAELVSRELIRVAILWHELWYEALEEASRFYFNLNNAQAMMDELAPLNEMMENIGQDELPTLREIAFHQAFARDLKCAKAWTDKFQKSGKTEDINQAWDLYYSVFARIRKQLGNLSALELANVAPKLLSVNDLSLAVPGTYKASTPVVRIQSFFPKMTVLSSKQRPRKVTIQGSNGRAYAFLLKGHEDLRQDERVMQLFGLINTLLANDADTSKRNLAIERYSVLPLSHSSGLIGWVPNCDTLHQLVRDYREARKIQLNVEHRLMLQMAPDYDKLALIQKVEAFKYALGETTGQDLYKVLWLKSQNSEVWLDRRRNYTRSLAVMSMAGYILGLGDRHPSNLMLDRFTGKIVHIDFGDCFEVAMERDKYPEKIPFRLTRMLTQAMEVSGIEGNFRFTCDSVMRVLRDNHDSLMAVLEAFVYDPLITWRLLTPNAVPSHAHQHNEEVGFEHVSDKTIQRTTESLNRGSSADAILGRMQGRTSVVLDRNTPSEDTGGVTKEPSMVIPMSGQTLMIPEQLNEKALKVIDRVKKKLRGRDFDDHKHLSVEAQVHCLIQQATSHENLCQAYYGWCPFW